MKPAKLAAILLAVVAAGALVFIGAQYFADNYLNTHTSRQNSEASCEQHGVTHYVAITDGAMSPSHTTASVCDMLTVTNEDDRVRELTFGTHNHHQAYDGQVENMIKKGQSVTVVLNKTGNFMFHDHLQDETKGTFTVSE